MKVSQETITKNVQAAVLEDLHSTDGSGDITAMLIQANTQATATVITREDMVLCGQAWFDEAFMQIDPNTKLAWHYQDGDFVTKNTTLCTITGTAHAILSAERVGLNFLQTLSGTASTTRTYIKQLGDSNTILLDTRKTIPGLRDAQKYATAVGGAQNHRIGLYDAYLIKENHILACGSIAQAVATARELQPQAPVEVEVENLDELQQALDAQCEQVLLDNFSHDEIRQAISMRGNTETKLEISGNVTLETLYDYGQLGVDYISIGALTKHVHAVDLSLRMQ